MTSGPVELSLPCDLGDSPKVSGVKFRGIDPMLPMEDGAVSTEACENEASEVLDARDVVSERLGSTKVTISL